MRRLKDLKLRNQLTISTYIMLFLLFIVKPTLIPSLLARIIGAFKPFIMGGIIAFLINLPMKVIEEKIIKPLCRKNKKLKRLSRVISLMCTLAIVALLIWIFINYIVPHLLDSLTILVNNIPSYISTLQREIMFKINDTDLMNNTNINIQGIVQKFLTYVENFINMFVSNLFNFTIGITNFFMNLFLGIIISIYILLSKEKLIYQFKKVIYSLLSEKICYQILDVLRLINTKFSRFILGQSTDGIILGTVFFIVFSLAEIPFAILISILIPILNFIPIFGTYVGIAISSLIILMVKPSSVILFLVLVVIIQQLDGKFVYPVVVGNSLGLSPLWILLAIVVGGNLFGVIGMILGMPLVSVVYEILSKIINKRIKEKNIKIK